jgi:hypothetical protein
MKRHTPEFRHFLVLAVPATAAILAGAFFYGQLDIQRQIGELRVHEASELSEGSSAIRENLGVLSSDTVFLSALSGLRLTVRNPTPDNLNRLGDDLAAFMNANSVYDQIRWIDETGMERLRLNYDRSSKQALRVPQSELQNKSDRYYFVQTIHTAPGTIFLSPFDLNIENGVIERPFQPTLRLAMRIFDSSNRPMAY